MLYLTPNFAEKEMECPCCGFCDMDSDYMDNLQALRSVCNFGFKVNSAYRCKDYNTKVSSNSKGQHTTGEASDIHVTDRYKRFTMLKIATGMGYFKDIAIGDNFIHFGKGNVKNGIGIY